jgi:hypothetical protein
MESVQKQSFGYNLSTKYPHKLVEWGWGAWMDTLSAYLWGRVWEPILTPEKKFWGEFVNQVSP